MIQNDVFMSHLQDFEWVVVGVFKQTFNVKWNLDRGLPFTLCCLLALHYSGWILEAHLLGFGQEV